jgi:D-glycero-alpha-D-manno-heptose-7-phosphate kinase
MSALIGPWARARAPLRIGFAGGGTDLSPYCDIHGGAVLNATLGLYAYAHLSQSPTNGLIFEAAELEQRFEHSLVSEVPMGDTAMLHRGVYNRMVREFNDGIPLRVYMRTVVDVPAGSGLGGSSTLIVAMISAYCQYLGLYLGKLQIAQLALDIERRELGLAGGRQDQFAAAFGGLNFLEFEADNHVIVNPLELKPEIIRELEASIVLYYTGQSRASGTIIKEQQANLLGIQPMAIEAMHILKREAYEMKKALLEGDIANVAEIMNRGWAAKKATANGVSNPEIEKILDIASHCGAKAGKVSGAGGGGFVMILIPPERRFELVKVLQDQRGTCLPCVFNAQGVVSWNSL